MVGHSSEILPKSHWAKIVELLLLYNYFWLCTFLHQSLDIQADDTCLQLNVYTVNYP